MGLAAEAGARESSCVSPQAGRRRAASAGLPWRRRVCLPSGRAGQGGSGRLCPAVSRARCCNICGRGALAARFMRGAGPTQPWPGSPRPRFHRGAGRQEIARSCRRALDASEEARAELSSTFLAAAGATSPKPECQGRTAKDRFSGRIRPPSIQASGEGRG